MSAESTWSNQSPSTSRDSAESRHTTTSGSTRSAKVIRERVQVPAAVVGDDSAAAIEEHSVEVLGRANRGPVQDHFRHGHILPREQPSGSSGVQQCDASEGHDASVKAMVGLGAEGEVHAPASSNLLRGVITSCVVTDGHVVDLRVR